MSVDPTNIAEEVISEETEAATTESETQEISEEVAEEVAEQEDTTEDIVEDTTEEVVEDTSSDVELEEALSSVSCEEITEVLGGDSLTEEDRSKIETVFTAAVKAKAKEVNTILEDSYKTKFDTEIEETKNTMVEQVDSYLDYIVEEWAKENALALESGIRGDIAESFIGGLKKLFEDHFITVPEGKYDIVEDLQVKNDALEDRINEEIAKSMNLNKEINAFKCREYFLESTRDLAHTEIEKLTGLSEDLDTNNFEDYKNKLDTLKEAYFNKPKAEAEEEIAAAMNEETSNEEPTYTDPMVGSFAKFISSQEKSNNF